MEFGYIDLTAGIRCILNKVDNEKRDGGIKMIPGEKSTTMNDKTFQGSY